MSKRQKLQRIRLELEQSLYAIIDETFNQLQGKFMIYCLMMDRTNQK